MKNILLLTFSFSILHSWSQLAPIESENLKGKIKSIEEIYSKASNNFSAYKFIFHNRFEFNEHSKLTSWKKYHENNTLKSEEVFEYDGTTGRKVKHYGYDANRNIVTQHSYQYDSTGNVIGVWKVPSDKESVAVLVISYEYDENGLRIKTNAYDPIGNIQTESTQTYNDQGRIISSSLTIKSINRTTIDKPTFDSKGYKIEHKRFNSEGELTDHWTYENDQFGNEITLRAFYPDGSLKYQTRTEYEYDSQENWTKKINFGNADTSVTERIISYY